MVCKQLGKHAYKRATVEHVDIPNPLNREFAVSGPDQMWFGDITCIWAQSRWHYMAVVVDLQCRRVIGWSLSGRPDATLAIAALDMAYEQRGQPAGVMFHSKEANRAAGDFARGYGATG